jgi:tetratricopeptide (TPR) repeat protein
MTHRQERRAIADLSQAIEKEPKNASLHYELGRLLGTRWEEGDDQSAVYHLERALVLKKDFAEAAEALAGLMVASSTRKAVTLYQKAARLFRERADEKNSARLLSVAAGIVADDGWELKEKDDLAKARQKALKALEIYPHHVDARNIIGLIHLDEFEYTEAERTYEQAIADGVKEQDGKIRVKNVPYWLEIETRPYMRARQGYGFCLAYLGRHKEALDQFNLLLKLDPEDHMGARFLLADLYQYIDDRKKAERYYREYGSFDAPFTHALLLRALGRESEARLMLKKASNKSPIARTMLTDYLYGFVLWETLDSYEWGTFPSLNLHRNALLTVWNANVNRIEDYETGWQVEGAYNFCKLCGPLWLKYKDSYAFLKEGHPAG